MDGIETALTEIGKETEAAAEALARARDLAERGILGLRGRDPAGKAGEKFLAHLLGSILTAASALCCVSETARAMREAEEAGPGAEGGGR
jgi:hypothetical protein